MFSSTYPIRTSSLAWFAGWKADAQLPKLIDWGLWSLVVIAPFAFGGRGDGAQSIYACLVGATLLAFVADAWIGRRQFCQWSPVLLLPVLAAAWLTLQLVPLPAGLLTWLSPAATESLPVWNDSGDFAQLGISHWQTISLHPAMGQVSLAMLLCHTTTLVLLLHRVRTLADVEMMLKWIAQATVAMAAFGLLQYATADGWFFWVYEHPFRRSDDFVCGSFINHNHFASFLGMGIAAVAYQLVRCTGGETQLPKPKATEVRDYRAIGWSIALAVTLLALVMTASRGGVLATSVGAIVLGVVYGWRRVWGTRQLVGLGAALLLLAVGLALYGEDRLTERIEELASGSVETMDRLGGRRAIWAANVEAIGHFWLTGAGAGTHPDVYPRFIGQAFPKVFTHAENGYLQVATETGLPGIALLTAVLVLVVTCGHCAWQRAQSPRQAACYGAVLSGVVVSLVHSGFDFVWYLPATFTMLLVLVVLLRRIALGDEPAMVAADNKPGISIEATVVLLAMLLYVGFVLAPPAMASRAWNRYMAASAGLGHLQQANFESIGMQDSVRERSDPLPSLETEIAALRDVLQNDPRSAAAHLRLARTYLQWFDARSEQRECRMKLGQLQGVVLSNGFESAAAVQGWLAVAIGDDLNTLLAARRHASLAVQLSPMEPLAYVCLASLEFLENRSLEAMEPLLQQAAFVAPHDGTVLFEVGKQYLLAGKVEPAIEYWTRCYAQPGPHRLMVVAALAGRIPASEFLQTFSPDWDTLRSVWQHYLAEGDPQNLELLLGYADQLTTDYQPAAGGVPAPYVWQWLGQMYGDAGQPERQIECLEQAMQLNPTLFAVRKAYGLALFQVERYTEAEPHLRWCVARDPFNPGLRKCMQQAATLRHSRRRTRTAAQPIHAVRAQ